MVPVQKNSVFIPENVNTSSETGVSIILRNHEFLTTKTSEILLFEDDDLKWTEICLLYTSPSPRDGLLSRMPSSA